MGHSDISARGRPVVSLRAGLLALVVLGIVGMHGIAAHCPPPAEHAGPGHHGMSAWSHHTADAGHAATAEPALSVLDVSVGVPDHDTVADLCMIGVCVAALVGLAWVLGMIRARAGRAWWRVLLLRRLALPRLRPRLLRPPTLAELSLLRC